MIFSPELLIILGFLTAFYAAVMLGLLAGMRRLRYAASQSKLRVSVVVAARNEERNIESLLDHLIQQDYPDFEVIIVNDRSTDGTQSILQKYHLKHSNVRFVDIESVPPEMPPKKHALAQGIALSSGEILCFTDADCQPPPGWISSLVSLFDRETGLVAGYSPYSARSPQRDEQSTATQWLLRFIEYEEFKGAAWTAGSIGLNMAWLCTGRSLAYRRSVFDEVGGFEKIKHSISGDDDLFLQLVRRQTRWKIRYATDPASFVPTIPPASFDAFVQQRIRHFSAGKYFTFPMKVFFFLFHTANLLIFASFALAVFAGLSTTLVLPYLIKCTIDAVVFFRAAPLFGQTAFASSFLVMEALYISYNTLIGPLGFIRRFEWKPGKTP
jgi:cellulose synthase/poly-beta-1,6-N-acetylglucosamine synthase-like glycosyltransferase